MQEHINNTQQQRTQVQAAAQLDLTIKCAWVASGCFSNT
jgi:hypothetical protein